MGLALALGADCTAFAGVFGREGPGGREAGGEEVEKVNNPMGPGELKRSQRSLEVFIVLAGGAFLWLVYGNYSTGYRGGYAGGYRGGWHR